jgi:hypothetical protein
MFTTAPAQSLNLDSHGKSWSHLILALPLLEV